MDFKIETEQLTHGRGFTQTGDAGLNKYIAARQVDGVRLDILGQLFIYFYN